MVVHVKWNLWEILQKWLLIMDVTAGIGGAHVKYGDSQDRALPICMLESLMRLDRLLVY